MSHSDLIADVIYQTLTVSEKLTLAQVMEAKLTKLIADRLFSAGVISAEGRAEMLNPVTAIIEEFDKAYSK